MGETSRQKGRRFVSFFVEMDRRKLLFRTPGKNAATVGAFARDLKVQHSWRTMPHGRVRCLPHPPGIRAKPQHLT
jgi:hypothetical protein